jgi:hypothetical protein
MVLLLLGTEEVTSMKRTTPLRTSQRTRAEGVKTTRTLLYREPDEGARVMTTLGREAMRSGGGSTMGHSPLLLGR